MRRSIMLIVGLAFGVTSPLSASETENLEIALSLAKMLQSARTVVARNQSLINDPNVGDKGLSSDVVVARAIEIYREATGTDPRNIDPASRHGRLLEAQTDAIAEVIDENQETKNMPGVGFKGFVPAVFARLVNERFSKSMRNESSVKVTAPVSLVRNRKALPDEWESASIENRLMTPEWPKGEVLWENSNQSDRQVFRVLVPEYYGEGRLTCHGEPKGEIDLTGYPKEGGKLGELGGVISITLFE